MIRFLKLCTLANESVSNSTMSSTEEIPDETANNEEIVKNDDSNVALIILVFAIVLIIILATYIARKRNIFGAADSSWKRSNFSPPPARAAYIEAKAKLDITKIAALDELKKLLMHRAMQSIPTLLSLQNEGSSIERLYKRGMLTDDMHFHVKELKAFVDQEFQDVQYEAEELLEGWGQHIWQQAMQFHQMIEKQKSGKQDDQKPLGEEKKKNRKSKKNQGIKVSEDEQESEVKSSVSSMPVIDSESAKAAEAERMAQQLLEEEENEKKKQPGGNTGGNKKNKRKNK